MTKKSGDFKALDEKGNVISDVELFLKKRDSGWMYTSQSKTDPIKDGSVIIAKFYTRVNFTLWDVLLHDASDLVIVHNNPKGRRIVVINF